MSELSTKSTLKEINAYKKSINWGDVEALYHMFSSSLGDLDGILSHGFDSAYKQILNPNTWNKKLLGITKGMDGNVHVATKPQIILRHVFNDMGYELHCYPVVFGEPLMERMVNNKCCPFETWAPERMQMLFRINSLVAFSINCFKRGDEADLALLQFSHKKVVELIHILSESFHIVAVKGYSIAEFYQEIINRKGDILSPET